MRFVPRGPHSQGSRYRPRLEGLESRQLLDAAAEAAARFVGPIAPAAQTDTFQSDAEAKNTVGDPSTLNVVKTSPRNGAALTSSPTELKLTFNLAFPSYLLSTDVGLWRVADDGTVLEDLTGSLIEPWDIDPTDLTVLPATLTTTLEPGRYQIVLLSSSFLSGIDSDGVPSIPLQDAGRDVVLSEFTVGLTAPTPQPDAPATLGTAFDLGALGPVPSVISSTLNLGSNAGNYQLFKFTLTPGHFWRLGAEVTAQRDNGTLNAALTLFDSQGRVVKTADQGRNDALFDPYLFTGLNPGTYYLGVSGSQNTPDQTGGYDPVAGRYGSVGLAQDGGAYRLHLVADAADAPAYLFDSQLSYADDLDPRPTGLVLAFSQAMDLDSFIKSMKSDGGDAVFRGLEVVDDAGRAWPLTLVGYDEGASRFTFLFNQPLPQGRYSLRVATSGGVTDLSGRTPTSKEGEEGQGSDPYTVLTTWTVQPPTSDPSADNNLGAILGSSRTAPTQVGALATGETTSYRFVVPVDGYITLNGRFSNAWYRLQVVASDGTTVLELNQGDHAPQALIQLAAGVYTLRIAATGEEPVDFNFQLARKASAADSVLDNGLGQGPALNLRLIQPTGLAPTSPPVQSTPTLPPPLSPTGPTAPLGPNPFVPGVPTTPPAVPRGPLGAVSASTGFLNAASTTGFVLTLGGNANLIGSPLAGAEHVAAVGPGTSSGGTVIAANVIGVLQGINYGIDHPSGSSNRSGESLLDSPLSVSLDDDSPELDALASAPTDAPGVPNGAGRSIVAATDWFGGYAKAILDWLDSTSQAPTSPESIALEPNDELDLLLADDGSTPPAPAEGEVVEHAGFATPLSLGVVTVLALRLQNPMRRWIGQRRVRNHRRRVASQPSGSPHRRV